VNGNKVFEQGHTHLRSYKSSICAVEYAMKQKMPKTGADIYFLTSLQRLSDDQEYIDKLEELKQVKLRKGKKEIYFNVNKSS
jgi:hypothetical protein